MINVQRLPAPATITGSNDMSAAAKPAYSMASQVIPLFNNQMNSHQALLAPVQAGDIPPHARQRIVHLLSYAMTEERPSLAAQISQLINNSRPPLTGEILHDEVERHLNQPSALNPQKTYAQLIHDILQTPSQPASLPSPVVSRARRELQNPDPAQHTDNTSTTQFANALVEDGDRQLSINFANHLIRRWVDATRSSGFGEEKIAVPPGSTFGLAWNALADALDAQPFKTFAQAKGIDVSSLVINTNGDLSGLQNKQTVSFSLAQDPDWAAASSAVLAAAKKLGGDIRFHDRGHAPAEDVAAFYLVRKSRFNSDDRLFTIDQLLKEQNFSSISNTDSYYAAQFAPVQQRQREAKQQVAELPTPQLNRLLAGFIPASVPAIQKVKDADQALARLCSQALGQAFAYTIDELPEYSTFNLARNNLKDALNSSAFTTFVRANNLDLSSIQINSDDGTLKGKVKGVDTTFPVNAISDWASVWQDVEPAVKQMATGSGDYVDYPGANPVTLPEVLRFYGEEPLPPHGFPQDGWQQRSRAANLSRSAQIIRDNGFKALVSPSADDARSRSVREKQQAVALPLSAKTLNLSPLETLAVEVKARLQENDSATPLAPPAHSPDTPEDALASTERALAVAVHGVMLELKSDSSQAESKMLESIPANSLIGQWRAYLDKALKGRGFTEWAQKQNIDLTSLRFDPTDNALIGKVNGLEQRFTATDFAQKYPEHFDVLAPVLNAAAVFSPPGKTIALNQPDNSMPFEWVGSFYGISNDYSSPAFARHTELMGRTQQFPTPVENPQKVVNWLNRQRTALGDSNDRYALIHQLKHGNVDNDQTTGFTVDPDSSHQPKGTTTVQAFLSDQGWYGAISAAQVDNLLRALQTEIPQAPSFGNLWGFLSTDIPLSTEQRVAVTEFVKKSIGSHGSLAGFLSASVPNLSSDPDQAREQLLSSDTALEFATRLQTEMKSAETSTSLKQWLLTALVLELDPTAGTQRNSVAGFDLMASGNWGHGTDTIVEQFKQHLIDTKQVPASLAPAMAKVLLAGAAPHLLVKDVPQTLTLGSPEWVGFNTAVNRIERIAAGATASMTFQKVMELHKINPISPSETQLQAIAQLNPIIDWAIINNHLVKNDSDQYSLEQLNDSQEKLNTQINETSQAKRYLRTFTPPSRRAMALAALRETFGSAIDFESPVLWEKVAGGLFSGINASIVEVYEAGRLGESWSTYKTGLNVDDLRNRAHELPDINAQFDKAIQEDFTPRRLNTISLFKDMLSKLPFDERNSLQFGTLDFLKVEGVGNGVVITSDHKGVRRYFAVYPATGQIVKIPNINPSTKQGHTVELGIDVDALKNGTAPKPGATANVALTAIKPFIQVVPGDTDKNPLLREITFDEESPSQESSPPYSNRRMEAVATALTDAVYLHKSDFISFHRGFNNPVENGVEPSDFFKGILRALPGGSSLEDLYHGEFVKAAGDLAVDVALYAATEGAGKLWRVAKSGAAWAAAKTSAKFIGKFGAEGAESIALKDMTAANTSASLSALARMQGSHLAEASAGMSGRAANLADGAVTRTGTAEQQIKATALFQDGQWHAYDPKTLSAYGPALSDFRSDTSIVLKRETSPDGESILMPEALFSENPQVINRATHTDLRVGDRVYRFDPKKPDVITDLESADHFNTPQDMEAFCPAGPRVKRGTNDLCFSNIVSDFSGNTAKLVQALEHKRLYPSPAIAGKSPTIVFERRLFDVVEQDGVHSLTPRTLQVPVDYLPVTRGTIIKDPHFGFPGTSTLANLEQNTRIVKLGPISSLSNDQRELRGTISLLATQSGGPKRYLTVEADPLTFYYSEFDATSTVLNFKKIGQQASAFENVLIKAHTAETENLLKLTGAPLNKAFVALPTLDSAFAKLEAAGYTHAEATKLRTTIATFSAEKKREFVYQLINRLKNANDTVVLKATSIEPLTKAENFANLPLEEQNRFYAENAKKTVDSHFNATAIGSANKHTPNDLNDRYREDVANTIISWMRDNHRPAVESSLKFGAGNCHEMAESAAQIIKKSGGTAQAWYVEGGDHVFTVVGGPPSAGKSTVNFSHAEWKDAWIVDPWADISCKASEYTERLRKKMSEWHANGLKIYTNKGWRNPTYPQWIYELTTLQKRPLRA
ncbi:hypothetical protein [Pseudomonas veronii]|uniref:hypothetical protein n=1 Tax=Pseudomonas veronii TaxID=76761 RepID=UPI00143CEE27|nr:hypothetical protein [Pseudomonas veronii]